MATEADVRRIALSLPETTESDELFAFAVRRRGFAWGAFDRPDPKGPRVPNPDVVSVRVADDDEKQALIAAAPDTYFSGHPFNGIHAVHVRLPAIDVGELAELLTDAWRTQAPKTLVRAYEADRR